MLFLIFLVSNYLTGTQERSFQIRPKVHVVQPIFPVVAHSRYTGNIIGKEQNKKQKTKTNNNNNNNVLIYSLVFST